MGSSPPMGSSSVIVTTTVEGNPSSTPEMPVVVKDNDTVSSALSVSSQAVKVTDAVFRVIEHKT